MKTEKIEGFGEKWT